MKLLVSVCLFWTLLSPGSSRDIELNISSDHTQSFILGSPLNQPTICRRCTSVECEDVGAFPCPSYNIKNRCYSKVADFPLKGEDRSVTKYNTLGCAKMQNCHPVQYTASLPDGGYIYMAVKCCDKDICNKVITAPMQEDRPTNGMYCPGCLSKNANEPCASEETVPCRGKENRCISFTGRLKTPNYEYSPVSFKGCAKENLCDLLTGATEKGKDLLEPEQIMEAECSCAKYPE